MKIEEVKQRISAIDKNDDECAHGAEDRLYHDFVRFVAESNIEEFSEIASLILTTEDMDFKRWCA